MSVSKFFPDCAECSGRLAKLENGVLPGAWIGSANGPGSTGYKPNKRDFCELNASLKNAVAVFIKIEDPNDELIVRHVMGRAFERSLDQTPIM